jgi:hypothetical protein
MSMLQVRSLSPETHHALKMRAAESGQSLSDYVAVQLDALVELPTWAEFERRLDSRPAVDPGAPAADYIRAARQDRP